MSKKIFNDEIKNHIDSLTDQGRATLRSVVNEIARSNIDQDAVNFFINGTYRNPSGYSLGGGRAGKDFFSGNENYVKQNFPEIFNFYENTFLQIRISYSNWYQYLSTGIYKEGEFGPEYAVLDERTGIKELFISSYFEIYSQLRLRINSYIKDDGTTYGEKEASENVDASQSEEQNQRTANEGIYSSDEWNSLINFIKLSEDLSPQRSGEIDPKLLFSNYVGRPVSTGGSLKMDQYSVLATPFLKDLNVNALNSINDSTGAQALTRALESTGLLELVKHADLIRNFAERRLKDVDSVKGPISTILEGPGQSAEDLVWYFKLSEVFNSIKSDPISFATVNYYMPGLVLFFVNVLAIVSDFSNDGRGGSIDDPSNNPEEFLDSLEKAFGNQIPGEQRIFTLALRMQNTAQRIRNVVSSSSYFRKNVQPQSPNVFGLRLGAANFYVPPLTINVNTFFKTGSLTGGAIRQSSSPKFNSGHKQTSISLKLFFPNYQEIWGLSLDPNSVINLNKDFEIDFKSDGSSEQEIDKFLSSLRGLVAAFKYSPILPIRNHYLNTVHGVTAVALSSMSISTVPNYPFALMVDIELLNFNHKPFLPMLSDFNQSIHWGKYRQYMGKAAGRLHSYINEGFLVKSGDRKEDQDIEQPWLNRENENVAEDSSSQALARYDNEIMRTNVINEWRNGNNISFYVPAEIQTRVFLPDVLDFRSESEKIVLEVGLPFWESQLKKIGIDLGTRYARDLPNVIDIARARPPRRSVSNAVKQLVDILTAGVNEPNLVKKVYAFLVEDFISNNINVIDPNPVASREKQDWLRDYDNEEDELYAVEEEFDIGGKKQSISLSQVKKLLKEGAKKTESSLDLIVEQILEGEGKKGDNARKLEIEKQVAEAFNMTVYDRFFNTELVRDIMKAARYRNQGFFFREWEVPMIRVDLDPQYVTVTGVSVGLGNNFAPLQIQMMDEPSYQHIGGKDTSINISMIIQGEKELLKFKRIFDHISSLSRLENAVGVIGFLGIKNVITALSGVKYVLPLNYTVDTIPNFPHFYAVNISLLDFDIFQQKREQLSNKQQAELIAHFSTKKNPFLRIKQLWGATNTYPDFPLEVKSQEGEIVGSLDPDYYFRSFRMFDEDVITNISSQESLVQLSNLTSRVNNPDLAVFKVQKFVNDISTIQENAVNLAAETGNYDPQSVTRLRENLALNFVNEISSLGVSRSQLRVYFEEVLSNKISENDRDSLLSFLDNSLAQANIEALGYDLDDIIKNLLIDISNILSYGNFDEIFLGSGDITPDQIDPSINNVSESLLRQKIRGFLREKVIPFGIAIEAVVSTLQVEYFGNPISENGLIKTEDDINSTYFTIDLKKEIIELLTTLEREEYTVSNYAVSKGFGSANIGEIESGGHALYNAINEILTTSRLEGESEVSIDLDDDRFHKQITYFGSTNNEGDDELSAIMSTAIGDYFGVVKKDTSGRSRFYITVDGKEVQASSSTGELYLKFKELFDPQSPVIGTTESLTGIPGVTPLNEYQDPYQGTYSKKANTEVKKHWEKMFMDTSYRDVSGRMLRAFPTYMLWLIDEGGYFAGVKMFDNFYGLQSIIDFSVVSSEDLLGDTLIFRVSNLYGKLTTSESKSIFNSGVEQLNPDEISLGEGIESVLESTLNKARNILSGLTNTYTVDIENIRLKPGVRVHLRAGYGSNPNSLQTIFNGIITQVEAGEIVTVTAQSDAIELGAIVNSTNNKGHSGRIDGGIDTGFWMSEPRDLMVRLLSMGSSRFREGIAWASQGIVFSENKFGIRHFGSVLYPPMNSIESSRHTALRDKIAGTYQQVGQSQGVGIVGNAISGAVGTVGIMNQLWADFGAKRDLEVFKRNIYPGNGSGLAQFLGGDLDDGWASLVSFDSDSQYSDRVEGYLSRSTDLMWNRLLEFSNNSSNVGANQTLSDLTGEDYASASYEEIVRRTEGVIDTGLSSGQATLAKGLGAAAVVAGTFATAGILPAAGIAVGATLGLTGILRGRGPTNIFRILGVLSANDDDDLPGYDEVSFRAQTYMRTVWDLFRTCARLLPNYIVAVRPFEDRSTVFYGKPHWIYTSGVVPVTTGFPGDRDTNIEGPDKELTNMLQSLSTSSSQLFDVGAALEQDSPASILSQRRNDIFKSEGIYAPTNYLQGKVINFATEPAINMKGCRLPQYKGLVDIGLHLPIGGASEPQPLENQVLEHVQVPLLPPRYRFPFFSSIDNSSSNEANLFRTVTSSTYAQGINGNDGKDKQDWNSFVFSQFLSNQFINSNNRFKSSEVFKILLEKEQNSGISIAPPSEGSSFNLDMNTGDYTSLTNEIIGIFRIDSTFSGLKVKMPLPEKFTGEVAFDRDGKDAVWRNFEEENYWSIGGLDNSNTARNFTPYSEWGSPKTPVDEQFYIAMRWPYTPSVSGSISTEEYVEWFKNEYFSGDLSVPGLDQNPLAFSKTPEDYKKRKVLVYNPSIRRAVVCKPAYFLWGEKNAGNRDSSAAIVSPDAALYLGLLNSNKNNGSAASTALRVIGVVAGVLNPVTLVAGTAGAVYDALTEDDFDLNNLSNGFNTHPVRQECFFAFVPDETPLGVVGDENFVKRFNLSENSRNNFGGAYGLEDYLIGFGRYSSESVDDLIAEQRTDIRRGLPENPLDLYKLSGDILVGEDDIVSNRMFGGNPLNLGEDGGERQSYLNLVVKGEYSLLSNDKLKEVLENEIDPDEERERQGLKWDPFKGSRSSFLLVYDPLDPISVQARQFYDENYSSEVQTITGRGRTLLQVQSIWDQFRVGYHTYESVKKIFQSTYGMNPDSDDEMPEYIRDIFRSDESASSINIKKYVESNNSAIDEFATIFGQDWANSARVVRPWQITNGQTADLSLVQRNRAIEFVRKNLIDEVPGSTDQSLIDFLNNRIIGSLKNVRDNFFINQKTLDFLEQENINDIAENIKTPKQLFLFFVGLFRQKLWGDAYSRAWLGLVPDHKRNGANHVDNRWSFRPVDKIFAAFIDPYENYAKDDTKFKKLLARHSKQGSQSTNVVSGIFESAGDFWSQNVAPLFTGVADALGGLLSMFKLNMLMMGYALNQAGTFSRQANILNKALNDSMYYSLGQPGSLLRAVDNPFTREYGEPVIEIREPFQRVHYLSSFSHIISNRIQENINGVATTVTAYSDGKYPVTVALDKALPAERQTEKIVETGIFYDNPIGSGLTGILHPLFHPLETARGITKNVTGVPDELMAKRVALAHLKESLQDIYGGEIIVIGNADIRPHDMVYLADVYERMYGLFEVEQVVHHFTPEMGYITSITPNALVTVNDPARWYMTSWFHSWCATQNMRNRARIHIQNAIATNSIAANNGYANIDSIYEALETEMKGSVYYTHGQSALIKDIMSMEAANNAAGLNAALTTAGAAVGVGAAVAAGTGLIAGGIATAVVGSLAWKAWGWVRDNVLDQHGCYISYLNKNGQPMDAGLSQNQGMAVGTFHSKALLPGILGSRSKVATDNGYSIIRNDDLLKSLGWSEIQIEDFVRYASFENAQVHAKVLGLSGLGPDRALLDKSFRVLATVTKIRDGDTAEVMDILTGSKFPVRFDGIDTAESNAYKAYIDTPSALGSDEPEGLVSINSPSGRATLFTTNALAGKVFTLRINPTRSGQLSAIAEEDYIPGAQHNTSEGYNMDVYDRVIGTFFYKTSNENRENIVSNISNIFRELSSSSADLIKAKVRETLSGGPESVFYKRFDKIYQETEKAIFNPLATSFSAGSFSEFIFIAGNIPGIFGENINPENPGDNLMFRLFVTLINVRILEATYEKASEWPLILWDDYYSDGSPVTLNWELVVNGLARVYTGDLNTLSPSAEIGSGQ
jgi:hypothetical protein